MMQFDWRAGNGCLVLLALAGGNSAMSPDRLAQSNTDVAACLIMMLGTALVASIGPIYALRTYGPATLQRPSWRRGPLGLWRDPLQFLATMTVLALASAIGSMFRLPETGWRGLWTPALGLAALVGLLIGQSAAYWVLRKRSKHHV